MEYNIIRVNNQLCKMYYSFSVEEMNEMYSDIVDTFTEIINLKNEPAFEVCLYDYIENHILDAKLSDEKIVCVSRKNIKRLTDFKKNVPYIGVATFATLPKGRTNSTSSNSILFFSSGSPHLVSFHAAMI